MEPIKAVQAWQSFARSCQFEWRGERRNWREHLQSIEGYVDEKALVQPTVFPLFAAQLLGFKLNETLAPEQTASEQKTPDFTPADPVTHPFVFETKSTNTGDLVGHEAQVESYLQLGAPRIRQVVLTNLRFVRVFEVTPAGGMAETAAFNLRGLLLRDASVLAGTPDAIALARFLERFRFQELSPTEKLERVRRAPTWNPVIEATNAEWLSGRLDRVVETLKRDVHRQVTAGALTDPALAQPQEVALAIAEIRDLEWRLGEEGDERETRPLHDYVAASPASITGKALQQFEAHVAYYATSRLMLVRIWEDLELLAPTLYDGGFDQWMRVFGNAVRRVIDHSFSEARELYRALFDQQNAYTWFTPTPEAAADAVYELANTYFGEIRSDILGVVYERLLERIDRKILGQYYTPRDIIALIWDLIDIDPLADWAEDEHRGLRVLDIATGSGGFLVDVANRLSERFARQLAAGAALSPRAWLSGLADGLNGVEIQRFPAYLAEINLLVQLGKVLAMDRSLRLPPLGILATDTLSLHNPVHLLEGEHDPGQDHGLLPGIEDRRQRASQVRDPRTHDYFMDVACGNPPYVGEKRAAPLLRRTRDHFPYWERFVAQHLDYQYWFLILGVSKLKPGGRFGFITTEYWLRAAGAAPLRRYLAERCHIERLLLFRELRLFPDAPGQHSMVVIGERVAAPDDQLGAEGFQIDEVRPTVSVYQGPSISRGDRSDVLRAMKGGATRAGVRSFVSRVSPNPLGSGSWGDVILSPAQFRLRQRLRALEQAGDLVVVKGVETTVNGLGGDADQYLPAASLRELGWPERKAGIFVLSPEELASLGHLTPTENLAVRRLTNTSDVYPYAVVPPPDAPAILYLPKPDDLDDRNSDEAVRATALPDTMPAFARHLGRFRALLEPKVRDRGERRPWWTLHRARRHVVDRPQSSDDWADYCVTTRWGEGKKLVVGLAPARTVPASSLHTIRIASDHWPAAHLVGLYNSSIFQEIAAELPPGQIRKEDLVRLGVPALRAVASEIQSLTVTLASIVRELVSSHGLSFPDLGSTLREDMTLGAVPDTCWLPGLGDPHRWGCLGDVAWVTEISRHGSLAGRVSAVVETVSLFGPVVSVHGPTGAHIDVAVADEPDGIKECLAAVARGVQATGGTLRDMLRMLVPTDARELLGKWQGERAALGELAVQYRAARARIDSLIADALG